MNDEPVNHESVDSEPANDEILLTSDDLAALPAAAPDASFAYGAAPDQVADLYLPAGDGPFPVALLVHGGCWGARWDRTYLGGAARALAGRGIAAWNVDYRRVADDDAPSTGGGWPATFEDVAAAADLLREAADTHPLDLGRVLAVGHSAGGHLAQWLAARRHLPPGAPGAAADPLPLAGLLVLAGIPDLVRALEQGVCERAAADLLGCEPYEVPERWRLASPSALAAPGVPVVHLVGARDEVVPPAYLHGCVLHGELRVLEGCGHIEPVVVGQTAWDEVVATIEALLG